MGWGGGGACTTPPVCAAGGASGAGGSLCLVPFLCLPWAGKNAGVTDFVLVMEGVTPIPLRFMLVCRLWSRPVWRPGALVRVRFFPAVPAGAGGWGGRRGPARGKGGPSPLPRRGGGRRPRGFWAGRGGWGWGGRAAAPLLSLWGAAHGSLPCPPSRRRCILPWRARWVRVAGPLHAPGASRLAGGGGRGGL